MSTLPMSGQLSIYEEVLLLSFNGPKAARPRLRVGAIGAAILAELALRGYISFLRRHDSLGRDYHIVEVVRNDRVGDDGLLDECFGRIHEEDTEKRVGNWIDGIEVGLGKMEKLQCCGIRSCLRNCFLEVKDVEIGQGNCVMVISFLV